MANRWIILSEDERDLIIGHLRGGLVTDVDSSIYTSKALKLLKKIEKAGRKTSVRANKTKGKNLQNDTCSRLSDLTGLKFDNQDDDAPIASRMMGDSGEDIILRGEARKKIPFSFECKSSESLDLVGTIEQARDNAREGTDWVIVHRRKAIPTDIIIIPWLAFSKLLKYYIEKGV